MASIGHIAIGCLAARMGESRQHGAAAVRSVRALASRMVVFSTLSLAPDLDVWAFPLGIPYGAPFGHRGASHSLAAAVAIALSSVLLARGERSIRSFVLFFAVVASHGLLDAMTDGGHGVALFWPWTSERYFLPWRPIPVAPIGIRVFGAHGLSVMLTEIVYFLPLFAAAFWPRNPKRPKRPSR